MKKIYLTILSILFFNLLFSLGRREDREVLTMCMGVVRSQMAAELLIKEDINCSNISDGFLGSSKGAGWKNSGLPLK